jgi:hypothetical protein
MAMKQHYLVSIPLAGGYIHGYARTSKNERMVTERLASRMMDEVEAHKIPMPMPFVMMTRLSYGHEIVLDILQKSTENFNEMDSVKKMKKGQEFFVIWMMGNDNPDQERLLKLH